MFDLILNYKSNSTNIVPEINCTLQGKFHNDEIYCKDDNFVIILEGVIVNLGALLIDNNVKTIKDLIIKLYKNNNDTFYDVFRGSFRGVLYDLNSKKILVYTDHQGSKPVFYYKKDDICIITSSIDKMTSIIKDRGYTLSIDEGGAYSLITYACMYDNKTIFKNVEKLVAGNYIKCDAENLNLSVQKYYCLKKHINWSISEEEAIEKIDELFLNAVKMQADKNKEYGLCNYTPLSAGLDSRMTTYALKRLGEDVISFTYSQSRQRDNTVPMAIASELKNDWIFKSLDSGNDMLDIDKSIAISDSLTYYLWPAQLNNFLRYINTENMGIVHTGVMGDAIVAAEYGTSEEGRKYIIGDWANSKKLVHKASLFLNGDIYEDSELGALYNRGFNGVGLGYSMTFQLYGESMSPFMNVEFMEFCLSLPIKMRLGYNIYYKWVKRCYPDAAKYSHNGIKIKEASRYYYKGDMVIPLNGILTRVINIFRNKFKIEKGMNPIEQWYAEKESIKKRYDSYFLSNISKLDDYEDLKSDVMKLYECGNVMDKSLVISLLGAIKHYI